MEQTTNSNGMTNNGIDWESMGNPFYDIRVDLKNKADGICKVDATDRNLDSKYYLTQEELDFLGKFLQGYHFPRFKHFLSMPFNRKLSKRLDYVDFGETFNGIRFCQSSFSTYSHLAIEDEIEEERRLYESDDILEHGFYEKEIRRWQMEMGKFREARRYPDHPKEGVSRPVHVEMLGCYFPYHFNNIEVPEVHLFMDTITETARRLCVPRWYIVVAVFLHEMAHAWFDRFPLLQPKPYIPEIEEPIAECLSLNILYAFVETSRFFYPHGELLDMFDTAYSMVYAKRRFKKLCYYSLGIELFHSDWEIPNLYTCFSYFIDEQSQGVKDYVAQFANGFPQQPYTCVPMLADMLNYEPRYDYAR